MGTSAASGRLAARRLTVLYVLDSTVLIDYLRGRPVTSRVRAMRGRGDVPATTAINVEEIVRGMRPGEVDVASRLFDGLVILPVDRAAAWQAGEWRRQHAARGRTLTQADCLVAATSVLAGAVLVTGNRKDFPMLEAGLEDWPVGE